MEQNNNAPKVVQEELVKLNSSVRTGNEIIFDPRTGELVVANSVSNVPDGTVITQIAEDGFAFL
jgi:hypothetical protein